MASTVYDPIMDALLALIQAACGDSFKTYSRRFMTWENLIQSIQGGIGPPQPALYLFDGVGLGGGVTKYIQGGRTPSRREISRSIVIYTQLQGGGLPGGPEIGIPGGTAFYELIEAVEAALEPSPSSSLATVTLGGLVTHCWIEGDSVMMTGDIDPNGQGMAVLPVNILIP